MASLLDSIRNVTGDSYPYLKIGIVTLIIFYLPELYKMSQFDLFTKQIFIGVLFVLILGFLARMAYNTLNENEILMPSFLNPFILLWDGLKAVIALAPILAIIYFLIIKTYAYIKFDSVVSDIILFLIIMVFVAFFSLSLILYSRRLKIFDAYKIMDLINYSGDFIAFSFTLLFYTGLFVGIVCVPIGAVINMLFNNAVVLNFYITFVVVFLLICIIQYYAQIYTEFLKTD